MQRSFAIVSTLVAALGTTLAAGTAAADDHALTLRVEPGVAVPLTSPQSDRFGVGGAIAVKPTLEILPWFDANLTLSGLMLPSRIDGVDSGDAVGAGGGLRLKRPHGTSNKDTGFAAASPWLSTDVQYVRTGPLDRHALSVGGGVSVPTGNDRTVWVGPFVKYFNIVDGLEEKPRFDQRDAKLLIVGVNFEFGAPPKKAERRPEEKRVEEKQDVIDEEPRQKQDVIDEEPRQKQEKKAEPVLVEIVGTVQFPFDSAVPLPESNEVLKAAVKALKEHAEWRAELQGHASSEGHPAYNDGLSVRRAQAVADYLTKNGVDSERLTVKGFGSRVPAADNSTESGRVRNRRVEFKVDIVLKNDGGSQ